MALARRIPLAFLAASLACLAPAAWAQQKFPSKPIQIVVPLTPGGSPDVLARVIAERMTDTMGQPVVVVNKPGASGTIGTAFVAKADPDGYTLGIAPDQTVTVNPVLHPKLPYDTLTELQGVSMLGRVPVVLVVNPNKVPATNVREFIAYLKANPDKLSYASSGAGGPQHMSAELFKSMTGTRMTHVTYKGSAPALVDVLGGVVDVMFCPLNSALPHIRTGKLRALGAAGPKRIELLPDLPTIAETVPHYESEIWIGLVAPAKTPMDIVNRINAEVKAALSRPDVREKLAAQAITPDTSTADEFHKLIASDQKRWAKVIKEANIKPE